MGGVHVVSKRWVQKRFGGVQKGLLGGIQKGWLLNQVGIEQRITVNILMGRTRTALELDSL